MADDSAPASPEREPRASEPAMDFGSYLQKGLQILQLDGETIRSVYRDEDALVPGIIFFAVAGVAGGVAQFSLSGMLFGLVMSTLLSFVVVGILNVLAQLFGARCTFLELYRPIGIASPIHWVQVVPVLGIFLGLIATLYSLVVAARVLEVVSGLPRSKASLVVLLLVLTTLFLCLSFLALVGSLLIFQAVMPPWT